MLVGDMQRNRNSWLIGDVGATSSRIGTYAGDAVADVEIYRNDDFDSLESLLGFHIERSASRPPSAVLAVAAPIDGDDVALMNRDWCFSRSSVAALGFDDVRFLNDFHAIAYALPALGDDDRMEIGTATSYRDGNIAVLGPGSGLGMGAWIDGQAAMTGEGGHITLSGRNEREDAIIAAVRDRFGHASAERVLSGPGIVALHEAMHGEKIATPEEITGTPDTDAKIETMEQFFRFLGSAAAELALITGASGGVYIAGGIVPAHRDWIARSQFRERFDDKNRYKDYMRAIPTWVITDPLPGLRGVAALIDRDLSAAR